MMFPDLSATPWRLICLSERQEVFTLVDADDHAWIVAAGLTYNISWGSRSRGKLYAKRNVGKNRETVRLHREIMLRQGPCLLCAGMGASPCGHVVDHINGQSLDNRKSNLRWSTKADNDRHRVFNPPSIAAIVAKLLLQAALHSPETSLADAALVLADLEATF